MDLRERKGEAEEGDWREEFESDELFIRRTEEFEEEEGDLAYGVFSREALLGIFWDEDLAKLFKEAVQNNDW